MEFNNFQISGTQGGDSFSRVIVRQLQLPDSSGPADTKLGILRWRILAED